jgi:predicted AlkP superfamily phosphohydrolase/phosphomutase
MMVKENQVTRRSRVFAIGLDGGTYAVLRPLIEKGHLPTLAALMNGGAWGELFSTVPPHTAPAWASLLTGKNPGQHGVFQFRSINRSLYQEGHSKIVNSRSLSGQTLWHLIGRASKRVGLMNVPLTYPPQPVNGFLVTGMLTPRGASNFTYPQELASTLSDYQIDLSVGDDQYGVLFDLDTEDPQVLRRFIDELTALMNRRTETALRLVQKYDPDFFMIFYTETDRLQHILWPFLDLGQMPSSVGSRIHQMVEDFYKRLDENLSKIVKMAGENGITIIFSDHGFGPSTSHNVNFNVWLRDKGLLRLKKSPRSAFHPKNLLRKMGVSREALYSVLSSVFSGQSVRRLRRGWGKVVSAPIDWENTRAVFVPIFEFVGGIQILLNSHAHLGDDRWPHDYEHFREDLIKELLALRDPFTGQAMVSEAVPRENLYTGRRAGDAPDIIFILDSKYHGERGFMSKSLVTKKSQRISLWTGTHRREGIIILNGPDIATGQLSTAPSIYDLTPTILYLLGLPVPEDMDGKVIETALVPGYRERHQIRYVRPVSSPDEREDESKSGLSEEEEVEVRKQLEGLGYLS